jgi:cell division protein FtsI (penicillin-binding protein 3)
MSTSRTRPPRPAARTGRAPGTGRGGPGRRPPASRHLAPTPAVRRRPGRPVRHRPASRRLVALLLVFFILFGGLTVKLAQLQAVSPDRYAELARSQRTRQETLPASRGDLLDRNGLPLVTSVERKTIWADSRLVEDPLAAAAALSPLLKLDAEELQRQLASGDRFIYLARLVADDVAEQVAALALPGINLVDEPTRYLPSGDLASSVLGMVDIDNVGTAGLEQQYDELLAGRPGELVEEESSDGHSIPSGVRHYLPALPGSDLVLTLDRDLQHDVEEAVKAQVASTQAAHGAAVVLDPHTGEVYALASVANSQQGPVTTAQNLATTFTYEPGSVMKSITVAAALEDAGLTSESRLTVPLSVTIYDETFWAEHRAAEEEMSVRDILALSDNVGTITLAQLVGEASLDDHLHRFGFGRPTGLGFPREEHGLLPALADWWGTSLPTLAIGQGVSVTAMQLATAYGAIANGGERVTPTLVRARVEPDGDQVPMGGAPRERIIDEDTAAQLRDMLRAVVDDGTGAAAALAGHEVAGKTGTAWKAQGGSYLGAEGRAYVASFAGFVPAEDPELVIVVMIDEPRGAHYSGGDAAAPAFSAIAGPALVRLGIAPKGGVGEVHPDGRVRATPAEPAPTTTTTAPPPPTAGGAPAAGTTPAGAPTGATTPGTVAASAPAGAPAAGPQATTPTSPSPAAEAGG